MKYSGSSASRSVLSKAYVKSVGEQQPYTNRLIQTKVGKIMKGDHTFRVAFTSTQYFDRVYEALFTVMNGKGEIMGYWLCQSKSLEELSEELKQVDILM